MASAPESSTEATEPTLGTGSRLIAGAAGWIAVVMIFALLWQRVPLRAVRDAAMGADPVLLALAMLLGLFSEVLVSSAKTRRILALLGATLSLWETIVLRMGAYPMRQLLPFKSGELVRLAYLKRRYGLPLPRAGLLPILDAATNAGAVVTFAGIGLALREATRGLGVLLAVGVIGAAVATARLWRPALVEWLRPSNEGRPLSDARSHATMIAVWTTVLVALELVNYTLVLRGFHIDLPLSATVFLVSVVVFAAGLPTTPMGLGVRETAITSLLAPYGSPAELLAAAVTCSAVLRLGPLLVGTAFVRPFMHRMLAPAHGSVTPRPRE